MKTKLLLLLVIFLATSSVATAIQEPQDYKVLYEKAKYTMETEADLQEAITLFESLINTYPDEKEYAAKAQYQIGLCYEKLGLKEAQKAYQKVLDNYPDQAQEISLARERLQRLLARQEPPLKPGFKKVQIPTMLSWNMALSPDGKKLLLVSDKKLWVMPLSGNLGADFPGEPVQLNTGDIEVEWTGLSWSRDGKWIAFNEFPLNDTLIQKEGHQSIYVIPVEGGTPRKVHENARKARTVNYKLSLSPRGETLAFSSIENKKQSIQTIPVAGGDPVRLTEMKSREPVFSPDGKLIAFVEDDLLGVGGGGLWTMHAAGGTPTRVAEAGKASSPVWSPDAAYIAYVDFTEQTKIFLVPVDGEGKPSGEKITIQAPEGIEDVPLLVGWAPGNRIGALMVSPQEFNLYTLPEQGGQAALILHGVRPVQPRYTPDGEQVLLVKLASEKTLPPNNALAVVPVEGGKERDILSFSEDGLYFMGFQTGISVSPDGQKILLAAQHRDALKLVSNFPLMCIWAIGADGEDPVQITHPESPYTDISPTWSPDGKSFAFIRIRMLERQGDMFGESSIYLSASPGEEPRMLKSVSGQWINSLNWSPDGEMLAYVSAKKEDPYPSMIRVIHVQDGASVLTREISGGGANVELAWSADSKQIAYIDMDMDSKGIKVMTLEDSSIRKVETGLSDTMIYHLDWSPDGERFVFVGFKGGIREFWWMENFLPGSTVE